ncbi:hypothetical protein PHLH7_13980 [Pseudomonas sp. Ost2]|nr:hypothetical protein PHLH7_13980 [Pseudomonas sp. Ost2]
MSTPFDSLLCKNSLRKNPLRKNTFRKNTLRKNTRARMPFTLKRLA